MPAQRRSGGKRAARAGVQQRSGVPLIQRRCPSDCEIDAGQDPLPGPARTHSTMKNVRMHAALDCLAARYDGVLSLDQLVESGKAFHKRTVPAATDTPGATRSRFTL